MRRELWKLAIVAGAGLAAFLPLIPAEPAAQAQETPATVLVAPAEMIELGETIPVLARMVATVESAVAARTEGVVQDVLFRVGDRVKAGDVLVRLDADLIDIQRRTAAAALASAQAGVEVAEASARRAEQAFERQSGLQGSTAFSKGQYEDLEQSAAQARAELVRAQAEVGRAEAALARADYDLTHSTIRAPFDGIVISREAQPGSYMATGESVAMLIDIDALEIEADMPVTLVPALDEGMEITARVDGARDVTATLRSILPVETVSTRTRPVRFSVDLAALDGVALADGKSLTLAVPAVAARETLMIPKDALVQGSGGWRVFIVEDGEAKPRDVTIGQPNGLNVEVLSGVAEGDLVVVRGNERLRPGQKVTPRPADPAAETARGSTGRS